jgi:hypothetical protein
MKLRICTFLIALPLICIVNPAIGQDITIDTDVSSFVFSLMDPTDRFIILPPVAPLSTFESTCAANQVQLVNVCDFDEINDSIHALSAVDLGQTVNDGQIVGNHHTYASSQADWNGTILTIRQVHLDHDVIPTNTLITDSKVGARLRATATATIQVTNAVQGYIINVGELHVDDRITSQPFDPEDIVYMPGVAGPPNPFKSVTTSFSGSQLFFPGDSGTLTVTVDSTVLREVAGGFWVNDNGTTTLVLDDFDFVRNVELPIEIEPLTYEAIAASPDFELVDTNAAGVELIQLYGNSILAVLYDGTEFIRLGFRDAEHTNVNGVQRSFAYELTDSGKVIGGSDRFLGAQFHGHSAWIYDGLSTAKIGFRDHEHTRSDGYQYSSADDITESGKVLGTSQRYGGSDFLGWSTWILDGNSTIRIGLTDSEHTRSDGFQMTFGAGMNEAGQAAGESSRYIGGADAGSSAWYFDGIVTTRIGLTGAAFTATNGEQSSFASFINSVGQVTGTSRRYNGNDVAGRTMWFFDPSYGATIEVQFALDEEPLKEVEEIEYLFDDGLVLGAYELPDGTTWPFYYHFGETAHDFRGLIDEEFFAREWDDDFEFTRIGNGQQFLMEAEDDDTGEDFEYLVTIPNASAAVIGDFNRDGVVDAADYVVLRKGMGSTYFQTHYDLWRAYFGRTAAGAAAGARSPIQFAVPEPSALALALLVLATASPVLARCRFTGLKFSARGEPILPA